MPAYRCSDCALDYPSDYQKFQKCPVCGEATTWFATVDYAEDWNEMAVQKKRDLEAAAKDLDLIPLIDGPVSVRKDELFISSWDVIESGIWHRLKPTDLIRIANQVFEIQGYVNEDRAYWVRAFSMELGNEDLAKLVGP
jgi:hypothetical protein